MKWVELSVETSPEFVEPLSHVFHRYGGGAVVVEVPGGYNPDEGEVQPISERVTVKAYIPLDLETEERTGYIDMGVSLVAHLSDVSELRRRILEEEDWQDSWKKHFGILRLGKGVVVAPSWREYEQKPGEVVIRLDPGMAFGTGHHPTTKMCLELLEELVDPGLSVLDVGCGSGILSIAAARLGAVKVLGLDIDRDAARVAISNVQQNALTLGVEILEGTLPHQGVVAKGFDLAVSNISAKAVSEMAEHLVGVVRPGGWLVVSGILMENKNEVAEKLSVAGARVCVIRVEDDWVAIVARVS